MSKSNTHNNISLLSGAILALSAAPGVSIAADTSPFGITELSSGYNLVVSDAKCGGKKSENEAKCGGEKAKKEAKCGGEKASKEAKCGGEKARKEAKCGEAKCGGSK